MADYILRIGRHAEQSYWEISLTTVATQADEFSDFVVNLDQDTQTFASTAQVGAYGSINEFFFLGDGAQTVMDKLALGKKIAFSFNDTTGTAQHAAFSLNGLGAALAWIDKQQTRIGSERMASVPPHGLVPTSINQRIGAAIPVALLDLHRGDTECAPLEILPNGRDIISAKLDDTHNVYFLPCEAGAYNFTAKVYVESFGTFAPQYFAEYSDELGWTGTSLLTNYDYDEAKTQITTLSKARGIGDCGSQGTWVWTDLGFKMLQYRYQGECTAEINDDENIEYPPFPFVFEAKPAVPAVAAD